MILLFEQMNDRVVERLFEVVIEKVVETIVEMEETEIGWMKR